MKVSVTARPAVPLIPLTLMKAQVRVDDPEQDALVMLYEAEAERYAETHMQTSLLTQTLTATFFLEDFWQHQSLGWDWQSYPHHYYRLLPFGPVQSVTSVKDGDNNDVSYSLSARGTSDEIRFTSNIAACPVTVVYLAGFGADPSDVDADIRGMVMKHAATSYLLRETHAESRVGVIWQLDEFYSYRGRGVPVA